MKALDERTILLVVEDDDRACLLRGHISMLLPRASVVRAAPAAIAEGELPAADAGIIDGGPGAADTTELLRMLRGRGFAGPVVLVTPVPDDAALRVTTHSLGIACIARQSLEASPAALADALSAAFAAESDFVSELRQARRVFAAGQAALSLQHAINNPLAALMAEAQLLQMDELSTEQRCSVDRMVEQCRRLVVLVRRLDALAGG